MKRLLLGLLLLAAPAAAVLPEPDGDPDILVYVAFAERRAGRIAAAMEAYRQALAADPDHPGTLAYQGSLFLELGRRPEAEASLARLVATCPGCAERETLARDIARAR